MNKSMIAAALVVAVAGTALAKDKQPPAPSALVGQIERCRAITDDSQRLACFDRESAALVEAVRGGKVAVVDQAAVRETRRSLFGFQVPKLPFFSGDDSANSVPDQIESTIKSVEDLGRGRYRIVIADHDAIWETIDNPMRLNAPRRGDKIVIKRGLIGAYFLRIDGQVGVKGRRVG